VFSGEATPEFDVIHLGMGADGHTASLFPGEPLVEDRTGLTAAVYVEKMKQWRVTLLPAVLLAARHTVLLATGADKAATIRAVLEDGYEPSRLPMQVVAHHGRNVMWFLDRAAAGEGAAPT
jgi:6-phosphogluconolactonase